MATAAPLERVTGLLARLRSTNGAVDVQQTTVSVHTGDYERAAAEGKLVVTVQTRVADGGRVLRVPDAEGWTDPGGQVDVDADLAAGAARLVAARTGVECRVEGVRRTSILCVYDEADRDRPPVYRVAVRFDGRRTGGALHGEARWERLPSAEESTLL